MTDTQLYTNQLSSIKSGDIEITPTGGTPGKLADKLATVGAISVNPQTGTTYALQASDNGKLVTFNNVSAITVTYPAGLGAGFNIAWQQLGAGAITFAASGTTLNNRQTQASSAGQYAQGSLVAYAANAAVLAGDTA